MINTIAVSNYRSILSNVIPLSQLNVVTGANGSGKSNLYRALKLLSETAQGGIINALATEGGLPKTFWAGPKTLSKEMKAGNIPVQGSHHNNTKLKLGSASEDFSYAITLGITKPVSPPSKFFLDPEIKRECIWSGNVYRPASLLLDRQGALVKIRKGREWHILSKHLSTSESIFSALSDPSQTPELLRLREYIKAWRFYDHFRTDSESQTRAPQLGTRTTVLHHNGHDLAAALQTIKEIGDEDALNNTISDAFPGATLHIDVQEDNRFSVQLKQHGLLRPLSCAEFSDGTLRYILLTAALLSPRPPPLMILNEPETSLHPDLLPALARLIIKASENKQIWVVSHANRLLNALQEHETCNTIALEKTLGETEILGQTLLNTPAWKWP